MLFIVQHQTSELWMKLMLHELRAAVGCVASDQLQPAFKMLARVSKIMEQLVHAWDVLATMTPPEYSALRAVPGAFSGFRATSTARSSSCWATRTRPCSSPTRTADLLAQVRQAYETPSLYDESLRLLARRGLDVPAELLQRDWTQPYQASAGVEQAWLTVYRDTDRYWDLYQLGEN